jgi:hypothetical protein
MWHRSPLPSPAELRSIDDDRAFFDPQADWFVPGLVPVRGEAPEAEDNNLGLRAILERPEELARAWHASGRPRKAKKVARSRNRRSRRPVTLL